MNVLKIRTSIKCVHTYICIYEVYEGFMFINICKNICVAVCCSVLQCVAAWCSVLYVRIYMYKIYTDAGLCMFVHVCIYIYHTISHS